MFKSSLPIALKDAIFYLKCTWWLFLIPWLWCAAGGGAGEGYLEAAQEGRERWAQDYGSLVPARGASGVLKVTAGRRLPWELCKWAGAGWRGAAPRLGADGSEPSTQAGSEVPLSSSPPKKAFLVRACRAAGARWAASRSWGCFPVPRFSPPGNGSCGVLRTAWGKAGQGGSLPACRGGFCAGFLH